MKYKFIRKFSNFFMRKGKKTKCLTWITIGFTSLKVEIGNTTKYNYNNLFPKLSPILNFWVMKQHKKMLYFPRMLDNFSKLRLANLWLYKNIKNDKSHSLSDKVFNYTNFLSKADAETLENKINAYKIITSIPILRYVKKRKKVIKIKNYE